ncbi:MAG: hypothetical protein JXK16_06275 [Thiotrichales bacterium]|nr:hypothetical protein [Thiotrichales bacterium]
MQHNETTYSAVLSLGFKDSPLTKTGMRERYGRSVAEKFVSEATRGTPDPIAGEYLDMLEANNMIQVIVEEDAPVNQQPKPVLALFARYTPLPDIGLQVMESKHLGADDHIFITNIICGHYEQGSDVYRAALKAAIECIMGLMMFNGISRVAVHKEASFHTIIDHYFLTEGEGGSLSESGFRVQAEESTDEVLVVRLQHSGIGSCQEIAPSRPLKMA